MKDVKKQVSRILFFTLFFLFIALYMTQASGYHEYNRAKTTTLTNEEIALFEKDLKEGKEIDPSNYLKKKEKNYDNRISQVGLGISIQIEKIFQKGMNAFFKALEDMAKTS